MSLAGSATMHGHAVFACTAAFIGALCASQVMADGRLIADIATGTVTSGANSVIAHNGRLFFAAKDDVGSSWMKVWSWASGESTASLEVQFSAWYATTDKMYLCSFNDTVVFRAPVGKTSSDRSTVQLGFVQNGTTTPGLFAQINDEGSANPAYMTVLGDEVYMAALGSDEMGVEFWAVNKSGAPRLVADIYPGTRHSSDPRYLVAFRDRLIFSAVKDSSSGRELFEYNGTDINPGVKFGTYSNNMPAYSAVVNDTLYVSALGEYELGMELWAYDLENPPVLVADIQSGQGSSSPFSIAGFMGHVIIAARDSGSSSRLFSYNGSTVTSLFALRETASGLRPMSSMVAMDGELFFGTPLSGFGQELAKLSNLSATPTVVVDTNTMQEGSSPAAFAVHNGELYFGASTPDFGREVWKYNSTAGVTLFADLYPGVMSSELDSLISFNGTLYATAIPDKFDPKLLVIDDQGASQILSVSQTMSYVAMKEACAMDDSVYSTGRHPSGGSQRTLWRYNTTSAEFASVNFNGAVIPQQDPQNLVAIGSDLYFSARTDLTGRELFVYNASHGARLVRDLRPGYQNSNPISIVASNNLLYFVATPKTVEELGWYDPSTDAVFWVSSSETLGFAPPSLLVKISGGIVAVSQEASGSDAFWVHSTSTGLWKALSPFPVNSSALVSAAVEFEGDLFFASDVNASVGVELFALADFEFFTNPLVVTDSLFDAVANANLLSNCIANFELFTNPLVVTDSLFDAVANADTFVDSFLHSHADIDSLVNCHANVFRYAILLPNTDCHCHANEYCDALVKPNTVHYRIVNRDTIFDGDVHEHTQLDADRHTIVHYHSNSVKHSVSDAKFDFVFNTHIFNIGHANVFTHTELLSISLAQARLGLSDERCCDCRIR